MNSYKWNGDKLEHYIDGDLRATVEVKNLDAYIKSAGLNASSIPAQPEQKA
jgi:hypothetical protein